MRLYLILFGALWLSGCGAEKCEANFVNCINEDGEEKIEICEEGDFKLIENCSAQGLVCDVVVEDCVSADDLCGNGVFNGDEACDDGRQCDDGQRCVTDDDCDDGSRCETRDGDGCADDCLIEGGFSCIGEPSFCINSCGDGTLQVGFGEECDDNNLNNGDNCSANCIIECKDGIVGAGEQCDDSGLCEDNQKICNRHSECVGIGSGLCTPRSGDGCSAQCVTEICGDGIVNNAPGGVATEECDDGDPNIEDGCEPDCTTSKVVAISAGAQHTCVITAAKNLRCWGRSDVGQLGYSNTTSIGDNEAPAVAGNISLGGPVQQVSTGDTHTCALLENGNVLCWGFGSGGRLGYNNDNNIGDNETPASAGPVPIGASVAEIRVGGSHSCARLTDGNVRCWGNNASGALGYGNTNTVGGSIGTPIINAGDVGVGSAVNLLETGGNFTCAASATDVRCWGDSSVGQLGRGSTDTIGDDEPPSAITPLSLSGVTALEAGGAHSCVVIGGGVTCWGSNNFGQLGQNNTQNFGDNGNEVVFFSAINVGASVSQIGAGIGHTCALLTNGNVRCWGRGANGLLGNLDTFNNIGDDGDMPPPDVNIGVTATQISAGTSHTCILSTQGTVRCWGDNTFGQLGYGNTNPVGDNEPPATAGDVAVFIP